MLGDVVSPKAYNEALPLYKNFLKAYSRTFALERTVFLLGDNDGLMPDYTINNEVSGLISRLPGLNKNLLTFKYKNLFFFHGNIENSFRQERLGKAIAQAVTPIHELLVPYLVQAAARVKFRLGKEVILLLGHIHYLGKVGNSVFCGTFAKERVLYPESKSLGYVVINDKGRKIKQKDILLHRLKDA